MTREVVYDYGAAYGVAPDGSLYRIPELDLPNTDPRSRQPMTQPPAEPTGEVEP